MSRWTLQLKVWRSGHKGQGMVEYAGALLVASAMVTTLIAATPGIWQNLYENVFTGVNTDLGI
jgi:hypothetical protein